MTREEENNFIIKLKSLGFEEGVEFICAETDTKRKLGHQWDEDFICTPQYYITAMNKNLGKDYISGNAALYYNGKFAKILSKVPMHYEIF